MLVLHVSLHHLVGIPCNPALLSLKYGRLSNTKMQKFTVTQSLVYYVLQLSMSPCSLTQGKNWLVEWPLNGTVYNESNMEATSGTVLFEDCIALMAVSKTALSHSL